MSLFEKLKATNKEPIENIKSRVFKLTNQELDWKTLVIVTQGEDITYSVSPTLEYTYVMEDPSSKTYKIGKTINNPLDRLKQFNTGNPSIKFVMAFPADYYSEATLHEMFKESKVVNAGSANEWFFQTAALSNFISNELDKNKMLYNCYKHFLNLKQEESKIIKL